MCDTVLFITHIKPTGEMSAISNKHPQFQRTLPNLNGISALANRYTAVALVGNEKKKNCSINSALLCFVKYLEQTKHYQLSKTGAGTISNRLHPAS